ncbi:MAG: histidinol-phosphatase [Bacteroidota bacterium]|nr:histidinol-phosphatase [Bacteroidota bacterium]
MYKSFTSKILLLIILFPSQGLTQTQTKWFKGNVHTHSLWSDGNNFPEMIMDWYKSNGYDFISLSDHNILAEGEKWVSIPAHPFRQRGFRNYLEKYGKEWVVYKTDSAGLISVRLKTMAEYKPLFEEKDKFLIMQAEEISDQYQKKPIHLGAINIRELIKPQGGNSVVEVMQNNLDAVYAQRKQTGETMFAHINHPNFQWAIKLEDMMQLKGERFFEVYNGHPHVHNYGDSTTIGMEELWDRLLIHYIKEGKDLVYGLATDDAHDFLEYKVGTSNPGRGWIMVRASELNPAALIAAMEKGEFYSTTGVEIEELEFTNRQLKVVVKPEQGVEYNIQFWGAGKSRGSKDKTGVLLKQVKSTRASYKFRKQNLYVRAKVISNKPKDNPYAEGDLETAWTQPVRKN